ncbi:hypothetical protein ID866_1057 [Astraeus odoratus]|nr:hypothetical protein ID866_1057 [Astraeus odoratus]
MDGFQFIIESPQDTQIQKKRPRLVTSCDSCRLKKIKCLQPTPEGQCEACTIAKIPCLFRDRERYFAERNRSMAGPTGSTSHAGPLGKVGAHDLSPLGAGSPVENYPGQHTQVSSANAQPAPHSTQRSYSPPEISYDSGTNSRSQCYGSGESPKCSTMPRSFMLQSTDER